MGETLFFGQPSEDRSPHRLVRSGLQRGMPMPDEPQSPIEGPETVLPSDPGYRRVAQSLMTCSPQPKMTEDHPLTDLYADTTRRGAEEPQDESPLGYHQPPIASHSFKKGQDLWHRTSSSKHLCILVFHISLSHLVLHNIQHLVLFDCNGIRIPFTLLV